MQYQKVIEQLTARPASDGDGVKLLRVFGGGNLQRFDPFLMLDEFGSDEAADYIGGFPPHPHRGFETVTYMLQGKMEHRDHMNNIGLLSDGGVQWMTAGKGIIHSEMPQQTAGKMRGFQLWVNLPAARKMTPASYKDIDADAVPVYALPQAYIKMLAGEVNIAGHVLSGAVQVQDTHVLYMDVHLAPQQQIDIPIDEGNNTLLYTYDGGVKLTPELINSPAQTISRFSGDGTIAVHNVSDNEARFIVISGKPIGEPIAHYGPFVMNTQAEIEQAMRDYQNGSLTT
ncbi:pirin family protein [Alteromonadaceae bacterium BrNp21-10]|nr:pirin family protein [Alteromonadaceae bacterium BrNp21-10]